MKTVTYLTSAILFTTAYFLALNLIPMESAQYVSGMPWLYLVALVMASERGGSFGRRPGFTGSFLASAGAFVAIFAAFLFFIWLRAVLFGTFEGRPEFEALSWISKAAVVVMLFAPVAILAWMATKMGLGQSNKNEEARSASPAQPEGNA